MVLLGPNWLDVVTPLKILSIGLLFRMSYKLSDSMARATAMIFNRLWRQIIYAFLIIIGAWGGSFYFGLKGVAVGVVFALFINFFLMASLSIKIISMSWKEFVRCHLKGIFSGIVTLIITNISLIVIKNYISSSILILLISAAILMFFYFMFLRFIPNWFFGNFLSTMLLQIIKKK